MSGLTVEEIKRAKADFPYFAQRCLRVVTKKGELQPMVLNRAQNAVWQAVHNQLSRELPVRVVVLKCRQAGISTVCQAMMYWWVTSHKNQYGLCVAHRAESAENIFRMARTFYQYHPEPKPVTQRVPSKKQLLFQTKDGRGLGSRIEVMSIQSLGGARSYMFHWLHLSEVSSYPRPEESIAAMMPSLPEYPGTWCIMESTGKGGDTYWQDVWEASMRGRSGFAAVFIPWYYIDEYRLDGEAAWQWLDSRKKRWKQELDGEELALLNDGLDPGQLAWRRMMATRIGYERFRCEYPAQWQDAFSRTADLVFSQSAVVSSLEEREPAFVGEIDIAEGEQERRPVLSPNPRGRFTVWEHPEHGVEYCAGVDTSVGVSTGSYSVVEVVRFRDGKWYQVAEWRGHADPVRFASVVEAVARYYNDAVLTIEIQGTGYGVQTAVAEHYHRFFRWRRWDEPSLPVTRKLGWSTQPSTKPLLIGFAKYVIDSGSAVFRSLVLQEELLNFVEDEGTLGAAPGAWDDCVMAFAMALFGYWVELRPNWEGEKLDQFVRALARKAGGEEVEDEEDEPGIHGIVWPSEGSGLYARYVWDEWG